MDVKFRQKMRNIYRQVRRSNNILLVAHNRPDGDTISAVCAFSLMLDGIKRDHHIFCVDRISSIWSFLPNQKRISSDYEELKKNFRRFDTIISMDCGALLKTGLEEDILARQEDQVFIEIDHHNKIEDVSDIELRSTNYAATCEILYHIFKENNLKITKDMANCLLTGILTDTANFYHPSTTSNTIKVASNLFAKGAKFPKITEDTLMNQDTVSMKSFGMIFNRIRINKKHKIAYLVFTHEDMRRFSNKQKQAIDDIKLILNSIKGVKALIVLTEEKKGFIKGSLRTNMEGVRIDKLANILGGGGHKKASAFVLPGNIKTTPRGWEVV
jgi:phosphoesterase RecJ-like protein